MPSLVHSNQTPRVHPLDDAPLTADQRRMLDQLDRFEAPYLEEKLIAAGNFASTTEYQTAFIEFKKYAALGQIFDGPLAMASREVDEVWHQFILFTREYAAFCNRVLGQFLHHAPHTARTSTSSRTNARRNFISAYHTVFGNLHEIWLAETSCDGDANCGNCGK